MKKVFRMKESVDKVREAISDICEPVISTLGYFGSNVMFETPAGENIITKDGVTVAKNISSNDPLKNAIINIIKEGSLRTNREAGDGTTTTVLYTRNILNKALDDLYGTGFIKYFGTKPTRRVLIEALEKVGKTLKDNLPIHAWDDKYTEAVASISSSNNKEITKNTVEVIKAAGVHGFVSIEATQLPETVVENNSGHVIDAGVKFQDLYPDSTKPNVKLNNVFCLVSDDKTYYEDDAQHILRTAISAGYETIAIFAPGFLHDSVNTFITNHKNGIVNVLLIEVTDDTARSDLATYLNATVVSSKAGHLFEDVTQEDFVKAEELFTSPVRTVVSCALNENTKLAQLVDEIQRQVDEQPDNEALKKRLGYLSSGIVTIKVGGGTLPEIREKIYKYEDAISAVRNAILSGFCAGGGVGVVDAKKTSQKSILSQIEASYIETIADSSPNELYGSTTGIGDGFGFDQRTGAYVNMVESGIIEPADVTKMAIENAISIAKMIISLDSIIVHEKE